MLAGTNPPHTAYYITEILGLAIGIIACLATFRTHPEIAWFSIAVILISWAAGLLRASTATFWVREQSLLHWCAGAASLPSTAPEPS